MKRLTLACVVVSALAVGVFWTMRQKSALVVEQPAVEKPVQAAVQTPAQSIRAHAPERPKQHSLKIAPANRESLAQPHYSADIAPVEANDLQKTAARLVSSLVSFQEKQAIWKQLREQYKLDQLIGVLEKGAADHPTAAEYPAALGQACINKIPASRDPRDPAILGLKADQYFDAALKLDPSNWEARFFKAASMSYWPPELNKTPEVIQQLNGLIEQQEKVAAQPQFSRTYALLGEQYQKAGYPDYARQVWQRGAALFPDNDTLKKQVANHP